VRAAPLRAAGARAYNRWLADFCAASPGRRDFPHPEGTWPHTPTCLRRTFHGIPAPEVAAMLGESAFALFDRASLRALADRIGPRVAELARPPAQIPNDYLETGLR
jgi:hypothetical protein